jgi:hypothetical protein
LVQHSICSLKKGKELAREKKKERRGECLGFIKGAAVKESVTDLSRIS